MTPATEKAVRNMITDRVLYDLSVERGLFAKGHGRIEKKLPDGTWEVTDWRDRPEVRALSLSDAPAIMARVEAMFMTWQGKTKEPLSDAKNSDETSK